MVGVYPPNKRSKMHDRIVNDSAIMYDNIGDATIIKHIPQDKRLHSQTIGHKKSTGIDNNNSCIIEFPVIKTENNSKADIDKEVISNSAISPSQIIRKFGIVVDVPGDGSCGYHAVMALLRKIDIIEKNVSITMMRREICHFVRDNSQNVIKTLTYCVSFRDGVDQDSQIQVFLNKVMRRIYVVGKDVNTYAAIRHWMDPGYEVPIIAMCYKLVIGYYDELCG